MLGLPMMTLGEEFRRSSNALPVFVRIFRQAQIEKLLPAYVTKYRAKSKNVHHYKLQPLAEVHFDSRYGGRHGKKNPVDLIVHRSFF
jgi:hypothetical protein